MKTNFNLFLALFLLTNTLKAQVINKPTLTVYAIDASGVDAFMTNDQVAKLVNVEVEKLNQFQILDNYDVKYLIESKKSDFANCFSKTCLVSLGETLGSDKILTGSIVKFPKSLIYTLKLINVKSNVIETTTVVEFLLLPEEIQKMTYIMVNKMFKQAINDNLYKKLTNTEQLDNSINNPKEEILQLDGPRMGAVVFTGETASTLNKSRQTGGYNVAPVMSQFGYQFEKQYLNEGNIQALFEFIPSITGIDQGLFLPSMTLLHGLRNNINGWEFAFGPTVNIVRKAWGYYDENNDWHLESEWYNNTNSLLYPNPFPIEERLDSRGRLKLNSGFVFAFGRTFKSGKMNFPVNLFVIPARTGTRFGVSFGFNAKN